jgi:hypothetical protein
MQRKKSPPQRPSTKTYSHQGDLTVSEYCRKFKNMADALANLGSPVDDRILVLNILHGLNPRFEHLGAIIRRYTPFPSFLKVRDDLILEELHLDTSGSPDDATALYTCPTLAAARPPAPTLAPPARQATAAPARRARTRRTPVAVGVVVVTPATAL